ncbi:MAG TPA: phage minor head protein [Polyangiaceae bacterium]
MIARANDHVVAALAANEDAGPMAAARSAKAALRWAVPMLAAGVSRAVIESRRHARLEAREDLAEHLEEANFGPEDAAHDSPRAYAAGAGLVAAWTGATLTAIARWRLAARKGERARRRGASPKAFASLPATLSEIPERLAPRVKRTAATEAAHAFVEARTEAAEGHAAELELRAAAADALPSNVVQIGPYRAMVQPEPQLRLVKVWSAVLDAKTCPYCARMDRTVVDARDPFPDGDPPVHPFCRCVPVFLETALPLHHLHDALLEDAAE